MQTGKVYEGMLVPVQVKRARKGSEEGTEAVIREDGQKRRFLRRSGRSITVFFPKVSFSKVEDVVAVFHSNEISRTPELKTVLERRATLFRLFDEKETIRILGGREGQVLLERLQEFPDILPATSKSGNIFVEGSGSDGTRYFAEIKCPRKRFLELEKEERKLRERQKHAGTSLTGSPDSY